jgi:hypothetical protein
MGTSRAAWVLDQVGDGGRMLSFDSLDHLAQIRPALHCFDVAPGGFVE